jgi:hypothetical protein
LDSVRKLACAADRQAERSLSRTTQHHSPSDERHETPVGR